MSAWNLISFLSHNSPSSLHFSPFLLCLFPVLGSQLEGLEALWTPTADPHRVRPTNVCWSAVSQKSCSPVDSATAKEFIVVRNGPATYRYGISEKRCALWFRAGQGITYCPIPPHSFSDCRLFHVKFLTILYTFIYHKTRPPRERNQTDIVHWLDLCHVTFGKCLDHAHKLSHGWHFVNWPSFDRCLSKMHVVGYNADWKVLTCHFRGVFNKHPMGCLMQNG